MHKQIDFHIRGVVPMLMHNGQLANPLNPIVQEMKKLTAKRTNKTESDFEELGRLEFMGSLYLNDARVPSVPGELIEAMMVSAGKSTRKGKQFRAGLLSDGVWPLIYDGPTDIDDLWKDERFRDQRGVKVKTSRVIRTRPKFPAWELKFSVLYLPGVLNESDVTSALEYAGTMIGLGDYRPRFGRFDVV